MGDQREKILFKNNILDRWRALCLTIHLLRISKNSLTGQVCRIKIFLSVPYICLQNRAMFAEKFGDSSMKIYGSSPISSAMSLIFNEDLSKYTPSKIPFNCSTVGDHLTMEPRGFM